MSGSITDKYEFKNLIGSGSYGQVHAVQEKLSPNYHYAIKTIHLKNEHSPQILPKNNLIYFLSTLREVRILKVLDHPNIIKLYHAFRQSSDAESLTHIHLVIDLMEIDMYKMLIQNGVELSPQHVTFFTCQLLDGLRYIHDANIAHRDLKSQNILVNSNCDLKICDFGVARVVDTEIIDAQDGSLTEYVVTRWYRAPEVVLNPRKYTKVSTSRLV
jgi:serine/threonine protein kinase